MAQIVGKKLLDHGYIRLVEAWGSDERIIEAARMSTSKGFLGWGPKCSYCKSPMRDHHGEGTCYGRGEEPGDEKLLRFLWENNHATPFEMAGAIIEVQAPIFVFREWHRHRTQCLAGETMITCVSPRGTTYHRSIKSIFDLKYGGVEDSRPRTKNGTSKFGTPVTREARRKVPWRKRVLPNCQERVLRVLNETTGEFETARMADVWESGTKPIFRVTTQTGRTIEASAEHPFFTREGWKKLKELRVGDDLARIGVVASSDRPIPPALRAGIGVWTSMMRARLIRQPTDACYLCKSELKFSLLELDHVVPVSADLIRALDSTNLKPICPRCHKNKSAAEQPSRVGMTRLGVRWERVVEVREIGEAPTYDIEVDGPHHNFVANGLVVHNSYNELSARYTPLPDTNYMPTPERCLVVNGANKQANAVEGAEQLTHEKVLAWLDELADVYEHAQRVYQRGLDIGIPKEVARLPVPVGRYSRMRASANLRNWLAFLTLRSDRNQGAQWEIRQFANALHEILQPIFPRTMALFDEGAKR